MEPTASWGQHFLGSPGMMAKVYIFPPTKNLDNSNKVSMPPPGFQKPSSSMELITYNAIHTLYHVSSVKHDRYFPIEDYKSAAYFKNFE